jgi:hypothetical protein
LYHRSPQNTAHSVIEQKFNLSHPRSSISHPYSSSDHFRSDSQDGHRLPYSGANGSDRVGPGMSGNPSTGVGINSLPYPYGQSSGHTQSPPLFGADSGGSQQGWQHRGSWTGGGQDRASHAQKNSYSPPSSWSSPNDSTSSATSGTSNFFPTLNTPFYPNQSSSPPFITSSNSHSVSQQTNSTSQYESVSTMQREFGPRSYGGSTSSSSGNSYSLGRDPFFQRTLPPMQLSGYTPSQPLTSSGNSGPPASLWRD